MGDFSGCGIVLEAAAGYPCAREAAEACSDCGTILCDLHADSCDICNAPFCDSCLYFHMKHPHAKPVARVASGVSQNRQVAADRS